jgi:hypothetical protein
MTEETETVDVEQAYVSAMHSVDLTPFRVAVGRNV